MFSGCTSPCVTSRECEESYCGDKPFGYREASRQVGGLGKPLRERQALDPFRNQEQGASGQPEVENQGQPGGFRARVSFLLSRGMLGA